MALCHGWNGVILSGENIRNFLNQLRTQRGTFRHENAAFEIQRAVGGNGRSEKRAEAPVIAVCGERGIPRVDRMIEKRDGITLFTEHKVLGDPRIVAILFRVCVGFGK